MVRLRLRVQRRIVELTCALLLGVLVGAAVVMAVEMGMLGVLGN